MHPSIQQMPDNAYPDLFSQTWLTTEPIRTIINTAPTGVALLQAMRSETGQIIDFRYQMVNPMHCALTNHPEEDLLSQPLTNLSGGVVETGVLERMIQVVTFGWPCQHVEEYRLDGSVSRYDQVYIKANDGILLLVQDVTHSPLTAGEQQQQTALLEAIQTERALVDIRARLVALISS